MSEKPTSRRCSAIRKPLVFILCLFVLVFPIDTRSVSAPEPTTRDEFWLSIEVDINVKPKVRPFLAGGLSKAIEDETFSRSELRRPNRGAL